VDRDTGIVRLRDYVSVDNCGVRISPMPVAGQAHGGLAPGHHAGALEDLVYDAEGQLATGSLMDYATPRGG
jgi:carbon-monoxide dehydrogenase large subunit